MTNNEYKKGEDDALLGTTASRFTDEYVNGFFNGLKKTNPLFRKLDEHSFREGYLGRNPGEAHNPSYLAGEMVRRMAKDTSELEKKVQLPKTVTHQRTKDSEDRELDSMNERRQERNLPPTTWERWHEDLAEHMDEKYGYDIDK